MMALFHFLSIQRLQNNFLTMAGHENQPKKFLLGQVSFLSNKKTKGKKLTDPFVTFCL